MRNNKGYALIYVVGVIALVLFLVGTLTGYTLQRTRNIQRRIRNERDMAEAIRRVEVLSMELADYLYTLDQKSTDPVNGQDIAFSIRELIATIGPDLHNIQKKYDQMYPDGQLEIILPDLHTLPLNTYTAEILIRVQVNAVTVERPLYITNLPSFLFFALGSNRDLSLFGGSLIDGDIYIGGTTYLSDQFRFVYNQRLETYHDNQPVNKPFITPNHSIYTANPIQYCLYTDDKPCHLIEDNRFAIVKQNYLQVKSMDDLSEALHIIPGREVPAIRPYLQRFLQVDLDRTFNYYLPIDPELVSTFQELYNYRASGVSVLYDGDLIISDETMPNFKNAPTFAFTNPDELVWIVVNGNLIIENNKPSPYLNINANFLVYGDVDIRGNVAMNSIIYTKGQVNIYNASILPYQGLNNTAGRLILLAKGNIHISKIHSFLDPQKRAPISFRDDGSYEIYPDISAFLHTEQNFEIYTVSSLLSISGGLFAKGEGNEPIKHTHDSYGLMVNSYRGHVSLAVRDGEDRLAFQPPTDEHPELTSRFIIQHSQDILTRQPEGLPINGHFNYLFGDYKVSY